MRTSSIRQLMAASLLAILALLPVVAGAIAASGGVVTRDIAGVDFVVDDAKIRALLNDGEDYRLGEYDAGTLTYGYADGMPVSHEYYFRNPGTTSATRSLKYNGTSYAPVRVYAEDEVTGEEVTVGHLIIDETGDVVTDRTTLMVAYTSIHTFGDARQSTLSEEIDFFRTLRGDVEAMVDNFDEILGLGAQLKALNDGVAVLLNLASGDVLGAAITTVSAAAFFDELYKKAGGEAPKLSPVTFSEQESVAVETAKLAVGGKGVIDLIKDTSELRELSQFSKADDLDSLAVVRQSMNTYTLKSDMADLKQDQTLAVAGMALDIINAIEQTDEYTMDAANWKVQGTGVVAMLEYIIDSLTSIEDGIQGTEEAEAIQSLKFTSSNMAYAFADLQQSVFDSNEYRKDFTLSGNIYKSGRWLADRLGKASDDAQEGGGERLIEMFVGDGTAENPGLAYYTMMGYYADLDATTGAAAWNLARLEEKHGAQADTTACSLILSGVLDDHYNSAASYQFEVSVGDQVESWPVAPFEHGRPFAQVFTNWSQVEIPLATDVPAGGSIDVVIKHSGSPGGDWIGIDYMELVCGGKTNKVELRDYDNYGAEDGAAGIIYGGQTKTWEIAAP